MEHDYKTNGPTNQTAHRIENQTGFSTTFRTHKRVLHPPYILVPNISDIPVLPFPLGKNYTYIPAASAIVAY